MKKVILSALAVFVFGFAYAQETTAIVVTESSAGFSAGNAFISGSVGFGTEKTGDIKNNTFNITPRAAYFVTDNIAIGLQAGYGRTKSESFLDMFDYPVSTESKLSVVSVAAFGRYYMSPKNDFSFFAQMAVGYSSTKYESESVGIVYLPEPAQIINSDESTTNGFTVAIAPGLSYFVTDNFALEATFGILNYSTRNPDTDGADTTNSFAISLNLENINFGLVYKF